MWCTAVRIDLTRAAARGKSKEKPVQEQKDNEEWTKRCNMKIIMSQTGWIKSQHIFTLHTCTRNKVISRVHLLLLLSVCQKKKQNISSDPGRSSSAKYLQTVLNVEKLLCLCLFLPNTLCKCLKSCLLNWHQGLAIKHTQTPGHVLAHYILYLLEVLFRLVPPVFQLLPGVGPWNLNHSLLQMSFAGTWPWLHPLISERSIVRSLRPEYAPPD